MKSVKHKIKYPLFYIANDGYGMNCNGAMVWNRIIDIQIQLKTNIKIYKRLLQALSSNTCSDMMVNTALQLTSDIEDIIKEKYK